MKSDSLNERTVNAKARSGVTRCGPDLPCRIGSGSAIAHHGELFQGVVEGREGRIHRALVSLPCRIFTSEATFIPMRESQVVVEPAWKVKALRAAELTLVCCVGSGWGGLLRISSNIQVGWGLGSSTSDVTAAIRATAAAFNKKLRPSEIALLAVEAEMASDSIMFGDNVVLFGHREGMVLEDMGGPLPSLDVLGFNTDPTGVGLNTLALAPARYSWWEVEAFKPLIGLLRHAVQTQDARLLGRVATASSDINQRFLPKPDLEELKTLARNVGAVGLQVAHSGTTVGLLFDSHRDELSAQVRKARALISEMGFGNCWHFRSNGRQPANGNRHES